MNPENTLRSIPMTKRPTLQAAAMLLAIALMTACSPSTDQAQEPLPRSGNAAPDANGAISAIDETMVVYMTPWCGCCKVWAEQSLAAGFKVEIREVEALHPVGVPPLSRDPAMSRLQLPSSTGT
jgi:hypothetical protein